MKHIATAKVPGEIWQIGEHRIGGVHLREDCRTTPCVLHSPTSHKMSKWPIIWRTDRHLFERICKHGIGHPDPDQFAFFVEVLGQAKADAEMVHGCDLCCH